MNEWEEEEEPPFFFPLKLAAGGLYPNSVKGGGRERARGILRTSIPGQSVGWMHPLPLPNKELLLLLLLQTLFGAAGTEQPSRRGRRKKKNRRGLQLDPPPPVLRLPACLPSKSPVARSPASRE